MKIQRLFIYPVKSILPVEVSLAEITSEGFRFDQQYILIKAPSSSAAGLVPHLALKTSQKLALFQPAINDNWSKLTIRHTTSRPESRITIPLTPSPLSLLQSKSYRVSVFGTEAPCVNVGDAPAEFFSRHLGLPVRLLFISGDGRRDIPGAAYIAGHSSALQVRPQNVFQSQKVRFADVAPFLVTTSASEEDACCRLPQCDQQEDVIIRFRPNIHTDVGCLAAYDEDNW